MKEGWKEYRLGELIELKYGKDHKKLDDGFIPVLGSGGIMRYANQYLYDKPSILIPRKGSLNNVMYMEEPFWTVDTMFWSKINQSVVLPKFLYSRLKLIDFEFLNVGSAVPSLTVPVINEIEIPLPPLPIQEEIAEVLGSLDEKIDLLHRQNKTLEAMAEALFRQWFIEEADDDWEEVKLGEHLAVHRGLSYKGKHLAIEGMGVPMHNLNSVYEGGGYKYEGLKFYDGDFKERHKLFAGDIIVTNTEQGHDCLLIGCPARVPTQFEGTDNIFSQHIFRLELTESTILDNSWIYFLLKQFPVREQITGSTNGSTVNMLPSDGITGATFKLPPKKKIDEFRPLSNDCFKKLDKNYNEIQTLTRLRDGLLPKLMSGEVEVGDVNYQL